jgi:hypothetical protein
MSPGGTKPRNDTPDFTTRAIDSSLTTINDSFRVAMTTYVQPLKQPFSLKPRNVFARYDDDDDDNGNSYEADDITCVTGLTDATPKMSNCQVRSTKLARYPTGSFRCGCGLPADLLLSTATISLSCL